MAIRVKKVSLTPAIIIASGAADYVMMAAPAAGYTRNYLGISHHMDYNSAVYTGASILYYSLKSSANVQIYYDDFSLANPQDVDWAIKKGVPDQLIVSSQEALVMRPDAVPAAGNSTIDAYIIYEDKLIDT